MIELAYRDELTTADLRRTGRALPVLRPPALYVVSSGRTARHPLVELAYRDELTTVYQGDVLEVTGGGAPKQIHA